MNRKNMPLVLMLVAGAVTCVINLIRRYPMLDQLVVLFIVLLVFYILGSVLAWTLELFDRQNEERSSVSEEGEVIQKESDQEEQTESAVHSEQEEQ